MISPYTNISSTCASLNVALELPTLLTIAEGFKLDTFTLVLLVVVALIVVAVRLFTS